MAANALTKRAMNLSLATGVLMLIAKWIAYLLTGSSVIFSDAAESVVHIVAVWFAWYALRVGSRPPDDNHPYGHDKVSFMSAGVEGGLICIAAVVIIVTAVNKLIHGVELQHVDIGVLITFGAAAVNLALGLYLISTGKKNHSLVVEANGRHVMTDVWTSVGAVAGLYAADLFNMLWLDPVIAIIFGVNIIWEGGKLVAISVRGLMDHSDPELLQMATEVIEPYCAKHGCTFHRLRLRSSGNTIHVDFHLQVPDDMRMHEAHNLASNLEDLIRKRLDHQGEVFTHLESMTQPEGHP
ncbi:MAG: cation transporter [Ignavibacteria bacterium]|nr:cation transporter [Ignavibacteria bacterium]